jgi:hypothetical protein
MGHKQIEPAAFYKHIRSLTQYYIPKYLSFTPALFSYFPERSKSLKNSGKAGSG